MKYALITGGSRGIGAAAARLFARRGWGVAVGYCRSEAQAQSLAEEIRFLGVPAIAVPADVADRVQVERMVDNVLEKFCQLDILVCAAGISHVGLVSQIDEDEWRRLFAVNVDGVHHCCQAVLPHMLGRKTGSIVTVSSMWGQVGASCEAAYSASKSGVNGLTRALAKELAPSSIPVNAIACGVIDTQMNSQLSDEERKELEDAIPAGRYGTPDEIARIVWDTANAPEYMTGQIIGVDGGYL